MKLAYRQHAVELAFAITVWKSQGGTYVPKHPDAAGGVDGCAKVVLLIHISGVLACSEHASLPMLPPVASVPSPPTHQPAPQHLGDKMAHGRTGGWLLAAETISDGQTTRPPEIIIDITSEEIRGHTSLSTALVLMLLNMTTLKLCLHERLLAYLSPDTVTGDDGRHTNRCRGGCRLKWNMSQFLVRSDTVIYEAANHRPVDGLLLTFSSLSHF